MTEFDDEIRVNKAIDLHSDQINQVFQRIRIEELKNPISPIAGSVLDLDRARDDLLERLSNMFYGRSDGTREDYKSRLNGGIEQIEKAMRNVFASATDGVVPEEAISILTAIIKDHDQKLASSIGALTRGNKMNLSSDDLIRDYVMSYADPEGVTIGIDDNDLPMYMDHDDVIYSLTEKLVTNLEGILESAPLGEAERLKRLRKKLGIYAVGGATVVAATLWDAFSKRRKKR